MNSRPFTFETEFAADGQVVRAAQFQPIKRAYLPAEVEALVAQARSEAREQALNEAHSLQAQALSSIAHSLAGAMPALAGIAQAHREQSAELAMAAARAVAGAALERFPLGPLQKALESLGQEINATPRLVVRMAGLDDEAKDSISKMCADAGFSGQVAFREEHGLPLAAFQLEWADGRAAFDTADAFARMSEALSSALASEAGHAEAIHDGKS